jgi:hypothetical protein
MAREVMECDLVVLGEREALLNTAQLCDSP